MSRKPKRKSRAKRAGPVKEKPVAEASVTESEVTIYTDGGCVYNPGPGGYGVVLIYGDRRKELSAGFRRTTNNRMEIMAAIAGLEALKRPCSVTVYSDSQYLVKAIELGWARRWKAHAWWRNRDEHALNPDLWDRLLQLCETHKVRFQWVRGHAGNPENERCDELARKAVEVPNLAIDFAYEKEHPFRHRRPAAFGSEPRS